MQVQVHPEMRHALMIHVVKVWPGSAGGNRYLASFRLKIRTRRLGTGSPEILNFFFFFFFGLLFSFMINRRTFF